MDRVDFYKAIVEQLQNDGYNARFKERYSGRHMYGVTVPAIDTEASLARVTFVGCTVAEENGIPVNEIDALLPHQTDSMGLDFVHYQFPA